MSFIPQAYIYASDGVTLVYTIGYMPQSYTNGWPDHEEPQSVSYSNSRSSGEIVIPAGNGSPIITIGGRLTASDYTNLISAFNTLKSTVTANTRFYLKIEKSLGVYDSIKVMRKSKIIIAKTNWVNYLYYQLPLNVNSWS